MQGLALGPARLGVDEVWAAALDAGYGPFLADPPPQGPWLRHGSPAAPDALLEVWAGAPLPVARRGAELLAGGAVDATQLRAATRWAFSELLADHDGLLLHGAALLGPAGAELFLGPSGAGKTTLARNARLPVLAEETVAVWREGGRFLVSGTPWPSGDGFPGRPARAPLRRVALLEQAEEDRFCPEPPARLVGAIAAQVYLAAPPLDRARAARLLDLVGAAEVGRLRFREAYRHAG